MFNKLSFIPTDGLYPVRFALDDFDSQYIIETKAKSRELTKEDSLWQAIKNNEIKKIILDGSPNLEYKMEDLIEQTKRIKGFDAFNVHGGTTDSDMKSYISSVVAIGDGVGLSQSEEGDAELPYLKDNELFPYKRFFMFTLLKRIPIWLVTEDEFKSKSHVEDKNSTEYLGCYVSLSSENNNLPLIYLCPERIMKAAEMQKMAPKILYAIVLIHELAHAIMDPTNNLNDFGTLSKVGQQPIKSEADNFMEESLANMITLQYFDAVKGRIDNDDYSVVKEFMKLQPPAYKFGIAQHEHINTDWKDWRNNKSTIKFWAEWGAKVVPHMDELKNLK